MAAQPAPLTEAEKEHFIAHGWLRLKNCFTREQAEAATADAWTRLGMDPNDKSTWTKERIHLPNHREFDAAEFAPKAWAAICELCGGEDKILAWTKKWRDAFIINLGTPEGEGKEVDPRDLRGWHVDGDFFIHYLDSPEQGLLVIPLFTDIAPGGGGTVICPEAMPSVARHLYENPAGVSPVMQPRGHPNFPNTPFNSGLGWFNGVVKQCDNFVEAHGDVGDVFLLHPLMLHSASNNALRQVRIITNPPIGLNEPFRFDRPDGDYTLVEKTTLRALGKENLAGWKITAARESVVPERVKLQEKMRLEELERSKARQEAQAAA
ncbi:uncharacterized protein DNG_03255 [Cephalotrichum gorgonifer]|uniref:PhyH domain-containing protein n=1 Tax=Cephalotrichum gorgonifer TaxID=2041049 RepID=A0AAE8STE3_9PEZI|nr:uncharacterized protein DNG_03255 [Cephalotrichum gorgonifer]